MAKVKHGNYDLGPHDFDLQTDEVELSPISGLASFSFVTGQLTAAKKKAIELLNVQLAGRMAGGNLTLSDFERTKEALDAQTGKFIPVEWQVLRSGSGHGERTGTWTCWIWMMFPRASAPMGPTVRTSAIRTGSMPKTVPSMFPALTVTCL